MSARVERVSARFYQGLWGILTRWFRVPQEPPTLPPLEGEAVESFQPAEGFLRYLKFQFWIGLLILDGLILLAWIICLAIDWRLGAVLLVPALALAILPDIVVYIAIHLRYDTTWYVMTDRSLRIRRGIWIIHETTITFENVQNVSVSQGPLQRWFGIANVVVETAGGGGGQAAQQHGAATLGAHQGLIEGVADAPRIRELLLSRMRRSRSAGLGDEAEQPRTAESGWTDEQLQLLAEMRDAAKRLVHAASPGPSG
jgi:membrane protein YdbS with pleckstrin-like domain